MSYSTNSKRINLYDIARGIGIIMVYIGHVPPNIYFRRYIYSFHMPLFFIISGMLLNVDKYDMKGFFVSRTKSIIIPAVFFIVFSNVLGLFFSPDYRPGLPSVIWFLFVLYFSELLVFLCWKKTKSYPARICITVALLFAAIIIDHLGVRLPVALNVVPLAAFFVSFGNLFKDYIIKWSKVKVIFPIIVCCIILPLVSLFFEDYNNMHKGHMIFSGFGALLAIIGSLSILNISRYIDNYDSFIKKSFIWLGKNSLVIYGIHLSLITLIGVPEFGDNLFSYFTLNILVIILILVITFLVNKYARFLLGKY